MQRHQPARRRGRRRRGNIPSVWSSDSEGSSSSDGPDDDFPSSISEASTEEDFDFGTGLYRTPCNCSSALLGEPGSYLLTGRRSSITLAGPGCFPERDIECCSSSGSSSGQTLNSSGEDLALERRVQKESPEPRAMFPQDGGRVNKLSSHSVTSSSLSDSSSSSGHSDIPQIGANQSAEPLQGTQQSRTGKIHSVLAIVKLIDAGSSLSCNKSSQDVSAEPVEPAEPAETAQPTEPISMIDGAYNKEEPQATGSTPNNVSTLSILRHAILISLEPGRSRGGSRRQHYQHSVAFILPI